MKNEELKAQIINSYRLTARKDHERILQRRHIIEERKEELENLNTLREREELEQLEEQRRRQMEAEQARLQVSVSSVAGAFAVVPKMNHLLHPKQRYIESDGLFL